VRKPRLREGTIILRVAKLVIPHGRKPYLRLFHDAPVTVGTRRLLFAFYDPASVITGWQCHTSKEYPPRVKGGRLSLFFPEELWHAKAMEELLAVKVVSKTPQSIIVEPMYGDLNVLKAHYLTCLDAVSQGRRRPGFVV